MMSVRGKTEPGFSLSELPLDDAHLAALRKASEDPRGGAFLAFEGRVRDHNEGRSVESLSYESYAALAHAEAATILGEACLRFPLLSVRCVHRVGTLAVGDVAVWVGVVAAHRDAAFDACRYVIDELKARVPIWKKETYIDATTDWVGCPGCAGRSSRHSHGQALFKGTRKEEAP